MSRHSQIHLGPRVVAGRIAGPGEADAPFPVHPADAVRCVWALLLAMAMPQAWAQAPSVGAAVAVEAAPVVTVAAPDSGAVVPTAGTAVGSRARVLVSGTAVPAGGRTIVNFDVIEAGIPLTRVNASGRLHTVLSLKAGRHVLQFRARDNTGLVTTSGAIAVDVELAKADFNAEFIAQNVPATLRAGQPYTVLVQMLNAGTAPWSEDTRVRLGAMQPQDTRTWRSTGRAYLSEAVAPGSTATFQIPITAPAQPGNYHFQWRMVKEGAQWFGATTQDLVVAVVAGPGPSAELAVTPGNVRVDGAALVTLRYRGTGAAPGRSVAKVELFQDSSKGYGAVPIRSAAGGGEAVLGLDGNVAVVAGVYKFKLRTTDDLGVATDSAPAVVNVTNSALLGTLSGVRTVGDDRVELSGWTCQPGSATALNYRVYLDAPHMHVGGVLLASGVADLSNEAGNAQVQAQCATPGAGHHFVVDLSAYAHGYAGRQIFVQADAVDGASSVALPCADTRCTMPGALRIGLLSPVQGSRYVDPSQLFINARLGGGGPYDEVALGVDDEWLSATADAATDTYFARRTGLAPRAAPYTVQARVRQGNSTVYSAPVQVTVQSGPDGHVQGNAGQGARSDQ